MKHSKEVRRAVILPGGTAVYLAGGRNPADQAVRKYGADRKWGTSISSQGLAPETCFLWVGSFSSS